MPYYNYAARIKKKFVDEDSTFQDVIIAYWDKMYELTKRFNPKAMRKKAWGALYDIQLSKINNQTFYLTIMRRGSGFVGIMDVYDEIWQSIKSYVENIIKTVPNISGISSYANISPFLKYVPDLTFLDLSGCPNMQKLSPQIWSLEKLKTLYISGPKITEIPDEIELLTKLEELELSQCNALTTISPLVSRLPILTKFIIKDCPLLTKLPDTLDCPPEYMDLEILRCDNLS